MKIYNKPSEAYLGAITTLKDLGKNVPNPKWQGVETVGSAASNEMHEFLFLNFQSLMPNTKKDLQKDLGINDKDWAEVHFLERVSGDPMNPPPSHSVWQDGSSDRFLSKIDQDKFSHTYPERFWWNKLEEMGHRYENGNLFDVVEILKDNPETRQAFLPMFLPEDLKASLMGERIPCSLGWHFIQRYGYLHLLYTMRSCDAIRHFKNDIYMAIRLSQWVRDQAFPDITLGKMTMVISSFHCFSNDLFGLNNRLKNKGKI